MDFQSLGFEDSHVTGLLERAGAPLTFRNLIICEFVTNLVCVVLAKDRNQVAKPSQHAFNYRLLKRLGSCWCLGGGFLSELGHTVLLFTFPNYTRRIGLSAQQGSVVGGLLNLGRMIGRPIVGQSSDMLGRINTAMLITRFCGSICLLVWIFAKNFAHLCFFEYLQEQSVVTSGRLSPLLVQM